MDIIINVISIGVSIVVGLYCLYKGTEKKFDYFSNKLIEVFKMLEGIKEIVRGIKDLIGAEQNIKKNMEFTFIDEKIRNANDSIKNELREVNSEIHGMKSMFINFIQKDKDKLQKEALRLLKQKLPFLKLSISSNEIEKITDLFKQTMDKMENDRIESIQEKLSPIEKHWKKSLSKIQEEQMNLSESVSKKIEEHLKFMSSVSILQRETADFIEKFMRHLDEEKLQQLIEGDSQTKESIRRMLEKDLEITDEEKIEKIINILKNAITSMGKYHKINLKKLRESLDKGRDQ